MKYISYIFFIFLNIFLINIKLIICFDIRVFVQPDLFQDMICSYRATKVIRNQDPNDNSKIYYNCICHEEYATNNDIEYTYLVNETPVQCNYVKKRRYIFIFLSICQLFGFEMYYLEYYVYFTLIFSYNIIVLLINLYCFILSSYKNEKEYFKYKLNTVSFILLILGIILYLSKIGICFATTYDANNIPIYDDLYSLIYPY